mgnify:CR=1 FL=1
MKATAVLEFTYPDDEEKFKHAMHGERAIKCIKEIEELMLRGHHERVPMKVTLGEIKYLVEALLQSVE